ncbi:MAG TPA: hypothetical protein VKT32_02375, partial [Chthonomonadaceae bacterium]|nr:hypothetical protein [Chthonomonadaceae bacterium]
MSEVQLPEVREAAGAAFRPAELPPPVSPGADAWRRLRRNPVAVACLLYIGLLVLAALFANVLAPYRYDFQ